MKKKKKLYVFFAFKRKKKKQCKRFLVNSLFNVNDVK